MATKTTRKSSKTALGVSAGILAAAAAGAGYYFYGDKQAKKHRQAASKWARGMKSDVTKEVKALKKIDQKAVAKIVDRAAAVYEGVRSVDRKDLRAAANELKRNWKEVKREIGQATGSVKKAATRPAKKAPAKKKTAAKKTPAKRKAAKKA